MRMRFEWTRRVNDSDRTKKSLLVNCYLLKKMGVFKNDDIENIKQCLKESYDEDVQTKEFRNLTFAEYVNWKRSYIAELIGKREFV